MASITLTIDDAIAQRVLDAFCAKTGWVSVPESGTKISWAKARLGDYIKSIVVSVEADTSGKAAYDAQLALSQSQIVIT